MSSDFTPEQLILRAKDGDADAFGLLYKEYFVPVFRYIYLRVKSKEEAEDLAQTVFLKVYQSVSRFEWRGKSPLAYFFTVARNTLIDYCRKKKSISVEDVEEQNAGLAKEEVKRQIENYDARRLVEAAINELKGFYKEVITLKFLQELNNAEIAEILGKSEAAIRQAQCRALKILREKFKEHNKYDF